MDEDEFNEDDLVDWEEWDGEDDEFHDEFDDEDNKYVDENSNVKYTKESARQYIEDFFGKINTNTANGAMTWAVQVSSDWRQVMSSAACHATFQNLAKRPYWIGSMFFINERNQELGQKFWDWMTDKKESPWKNCIQNLEPLKGSNGMTSGWIIPGSELKENDFRYIKNFAIACRGLTEHEGAIRVWDTLIQKGIPPADALLYASLYEQSRNGLISLSEHRSGGWHWPLHTHFTNINSFRKGEFHPENGPGITVCWEPPKATKLTDFPKIGKAHLTKFSWYNSIELQSILDQYKEWIKSAEKVV